MQEQIVEVSVDEIRISPFQPRRVFSEEELTELASSIQEVGLIQPPVVRMITSRGNLLYYELIAGERRWRAVKRLGRTTLPVVVRSTSDETAAKATLIENVQRVDLNPIEMAYAFKQLIDAFRMTQEQVAEKVGKKRSTVANYLRLLNLPEEIQQSIAEKGISMGHAKTILSLDGDELQKHFQSLIMKGNLTVRESEKASAKLQKKEKDVHLRDLEDKLTQHLGTKVTVEKKRGQVGGTIVMHFFNDEDLSRLSTIIEKDFVI